MAENSEVHLWIPEAYSSLCFVLLTSPQRVTLSMEQSSSLKINTDLTGKHIHPAPTPVTNTEPITILSKLATCNYADSRKSYAFPQNLVNNILILSSCLCTILPSCPH